MLPRWSRIWLTQPGSPSSGPSHCKESTRWKPLQDCPETIDREPPSFKIGDRVYFKNKTTRQMGPQMDIWIQGCPYWGWQTLPTYWKSRYWKNKLMQCQRCSTQTTSRILEHWHTIWQIWQIHQPPWKFANYHTQWLEMNTLLMWIVTCK